MLPVARLGDVHTCPICGPNVIVQGGIAKVDGLPVARMGDKTACGAAIVTGSSMSKDDNKPIAYLGSTTTHGGVISTGSPMHKVMP
ncbi:MAG: PAAR domain-containing protein [Pseudomonadota bacterium]